MFKAGVTLFLFLALSAAGQPETYPVPGWTGGLVFTSDGIGWLTGFASVLRFGPGQAPVPVANLVANDLVVAPDGTLWAAGEHSIHRIDPQTNAVTPLAAWADAFIIRMAAGDDGRMWVLTQTGDYNTYVRRLIRLDLAGNVVSDVIADVPFVGRMSRPFVLQGKFWASVSSSHSHHYIRLSASGETETLPLPTRVLRLLNAGTFVWGAVNNTQALKIGLGGVVLLSVTLPEESYGATVDPEGNLWSIGYTGLLSRVTPEGVITSHGSYPGPTKTCRWGPPLMAFSPDGRLAILMDIDEPIYIPGSPCFNDPLGVGTLMVVNPAAHSASDIPTLGVSAVLALASMLAAAGAWKVVR